MATILLKRGQTKNIGSLKLQEGEAAIAYNDDKSVAHLYVGGADGTPVSVETNIKATAVTEDSAHRFTTDTEKSTWSAKLGADSTIDGGTF